MNELTKNILTDISNMVRKQGYIVYSVFEGGNYHRVETVKHILNVLNQETEIAVINYKKGIGDAIKLTIKFENSEVSHFDYESNAMINLFADLINTAQYDPALNRRHKTQIGVYHE